MWFTILSMNVMAPVPPPYRFNAQEARMQRIPFALADILEDHHVDCVVVQESIVPTQHETLACGFRQQGYMFQTQPLKATFSKLKLVEGGVAILSKHPIVEEKQHVFAECACEGSDCLASKGFIHAKIDKLGVIFHVIGTHFQAWGSPKGREIRECQAGAIGKYLKRLKVGKDEPVFVAGDMNADLYAQHDHVERLFRLMQVRAPRTHPESIRFTSDPHTNELMGNDEDTAYANDTFPDGCYEEYMKNLRCPCCPPEWLDYVTVWNGGMQPEWRHTTLRAFDVKAKAFHGKLALTITRKIRNLSDHAPVVGKFHFPSLKAVRVLTGKTPSSSSPHHRHDTSWKVVLGVAIAFIVLVTVVITVVLVHRK